LNPNVEWHIKNKLTHAIHTSERRSFRGCRRRWSWLFQDHLYPVTTAKPLEFGSAFHKAMEAWYEPSTWNKDPETRETLAILAFVNLCNEQKAHYTTMQGTIDPEAEADFRERVELGSGMIRYHCRNVSPRLDRGFTPYAVEIDFEVPILDDAGNQPWCKCDNCWTMYYNWTQALPDEPDATGKLKPHRLKVNNVESARAMWMGLPVTYGGRIDMLAQDENGRFWIFDWKTAARLSGQEEQDSPDEFILLDDQITSYVWALWVLGIDVAGFVYHEIKKAFPIEPEPNKVNRKGCWYSVSKQQNTSYEIYLETISEGDPYGLQSGAYNDFLAWLKNDGPRFYSRKQVHRSETELRSAGHNICLEALDMTDPNLRLYPSPGRYGCTFCAYRQPCLGTNRGEDVDYMLESNFERRPHRYWETTTSSTESKGGV
jgi:hypothetical protein